MFAQPKDFWKTWRHILGAGRLSLLVVLASCVSFCSSSVPGSPGNARGQFLWEYWSGIDGTSIADLTRHPDYPDQPSGRRLLGRLESPRQFEDNYGARLRGYIHPPVSGEYRFQLVSNGSAELWLGRDPPEGKVRRATLTSRRDRLRRSRSEPIELREGARYYLEVLHKEGVGTDSLLVRWRIPGAARWRVLDGASLSPPVVERVEGIRFSEENPFPRAPFALQLSTPTPGATIRYTTDGSWPSATEGQLYRGPIDVASTRVVRAIAVKPGAVPTEVETRTYLFTDDVVHQRNAASPGEHWSTGMDAAVVEHPAYRDRMVDALLAVPSLSLSTSHRDMFGRAGIYRNPTERGRAWERLASIELLETEGGRAFQVNGGVRITGGRSRDPRATPKHSFRVVFRRKYGPGNLEHRLFSDSDVDRHDGFVLRAGFNHSWTTRTAEANYAQYLRNAFTRDAHNATGSFNGAGQFVHLYLNGLYWGLYFMEDRQDAAFAAAVFGGDEDDYDVIQDRLAEQGNLEAFDAMFEIANAGLETPERLEKLSDYLDLTHFIDYLIVNNFLANYDWPLRNWRAVRKREPGAQFRFFTWDAEWTLPHYRPIWTRAGDYREGLTTGSGDRTPGRLFQKLRENAEFRLHFADRLHRHFYAEDGAFHVLYNRAAFRYQQWAGRIEEAIVAESARWGGTFRRPPFTRDNAWLPERDRILQQWLPARPAEFLQQCRQEKLYPVVEAPTFSSSSGLVERGFEVRLSAPAGRIYFTSDGSDPRRPVEGSPSARAHAYDGTPIRLGVATRLRARAVVDGEWSALSETVFYVEDDWSPLRITEIMYHPPDNPLLPDDGLREFLELQNSGSRRLDVSGLSLSDGVGFTFPVGTVLDPGAVVVLAADGEAFEQTYGLEPLGVYRGRLDNGGERIRLTDPAGRALLDLTYEDDGGWPVLADGGGVSLTSRGPAGHMDPRLEWTTSRRRGGTPGVHP